MSILCVPLSLPFRLLSASLIPLLIQPPLIWLFPPALYLPFTVTLRLSPPPSRSAVRQQGVLSRVASEPPTLLCTTCRLSIVETSQTLQDSKNTQTLQNLPARAHSSDLKSSHADTISTSQSPQHTHINTHARRHPNTCMHFHHAFINQPQFVRLSKLTVQANKVKYPEQQLVSTTRDS